jgi:hypothetical protein
VGYNANYAVLTGSNWSVQTAFSDITNIGNLVLDHSANPSFCYLNSSLSNVLNYGYWNGSTWVTKTVDSSNFVESKYYMQIDSSSYPQVVFYSANYNDSIHSVVDAQWNGDRWISQKLGDIPNSSNYYYGKVTISDIAFGRNGNIDILYDRVTGTIRGAFYYGDLTYASIQTPNSLSDASIAIVILITSVAIALTALMFVRRHRKASLVKTAVEDRHG